MSYFCTRLLLLLTNESTYPPPPLPPPSLLPPSDLFLHAGMLEPVHFSTIVCYGIGHIGTCHIALTQFALLTELAALYQPHSTWLYDPVLHSQELAVIRECGCEIIARNEVCNEVQ